MTIQELQSAILETRELCNMGQFSKNPYDPNTESELFVAYANGQGSYFNEGFSEVLFYINMGHWWWEVEGGL